MPCQLSVTILSLFPDYFSSPLRQSILARAISRGVLEVDLCDIREYSLDRHKSVDDHPYGGGAGMVMMPFPIAKAIDAKNKDRDHHVVYLSPKGHSLNQTRVIQLAQKKRMIFLCGHYEGIDERIVESRVDEEISIGDYILTSGCPAALVLLESIIRYLEGVLDNRQSLKEESFENNLLEYPQYTAPRLFEDKAVPEVLLSGHHKHIDLWRQKMAIAKTQKNRPDLYKKFLNQQQLES